MSINNAPVVIMTHGKAGNSKMMKIFARSFPTGSRFFYPQAPIADPLGGYSWWLENKEEAYQSGTENLAEQISKFLEEEHLPADTALIFCGFSQGGAVLSRLIQQASFRAERFVLLASFILPVAEQSQDMAWPETFSAHGYDDDKVTFKRHLQDIAYLAENKVPITVCHDAVGHKLSSRANRNLKRWLE